MKTQVFDKNGFPKPFGMVVFILTLGILFYFQILVCKSLGAQTLYLEVEVLEAESELLLEDWMVETNSWGENASKQLFEAEKEIDNVMEPWMVDFNLEDKVYAENDVEVQLEPWMMSTDTWAIGQPIYYTEEEESLEYTVKHWMFNRNSWATTYLVIKK